MVARDDLSMMELCRIEVPDVRRRTMVNRKVEHLVEVAIVQSTIPSNREGRATHHTGSSRGIKRVREAGHILLIVSAFDKKL